MQTPPEPTPEQCNDNTRLPDFKPKGSSATFKAMACWYPQMGGYVGKCVVISEGNEEGCFEAFIWHDGSFPFKDEESSPARIHHCSPEQFIEFGQAVKRFQEAE